MEREPGCSASRRPPPRCPAGPPLHRTSKTLPSGDAPNPSTETWSPVDPSTRRGTLAGIPAAWQRAGGAGTRWMGPRWARVTGAAVPSIENVCNASVFGLWRDDVISWPSCSSKSGPLPHDQRAYSFRKGTGKLKNYSRTPNPPLISNLTTARAPQPWRGASGQRERVRMAAPRDRRRARTAAAQPPSPQRQRTPLRCEGSSAAPPVVSAPATCARPTPRSRVSAQSMRTHALGPAPTRAMRACTS
jgi:hypothetical protein